MIHLNHFIAAMNESSGDSESAWKESGCCDCLRLAFAGDLRAYFLAGILTAQWQNPVAKMDTDELEIMLKSMRMAHKLMLDVWENDHQRILFDGLIARLEIAVARTKEPHNVD